MKDMKKISYILVRGIRGTLELNNNHKIAVCRALDTILNKENNTFSTVSYYEDIKCTYVVMGRDAQNMINTVHFSFNDGGECPRFFLIEI